MTSVFHKNATALVLAATFLLGTGSALVLMSSSQNKHQNPKEDEKNESIVVKLNPIDLVFVNLEFPPISTLTWFRGDYQQATKVLRERAQLILAKNPWLAGRLIKDNRKWNFFSKRKDPFVAYPKSLHENTSIVFDPVVVIDPNEVDKMGNDEILIAKETDPGWLFLMLASKGMVVERGSMLSHTAITGRKFGIPTIVSVPGVTRRIKNGDMIEIDGGRGTITVIEEAR